MRIRKKKTQRQQQQKHRLKSPNPEEIDLSQSWRRDYKDRCFGGRYNTSEE